MKIAHLSYSDISGGAARATYRIHKSLSLSNIHSILCVNESSSGDPSVYSPTGEFERLCRAFRPHFGTLLRSLFLPKGSVPPSVSFLPSRWPKRISELDPDIVHLHWVQWEMLSIVDIARISRPLVWTLHDMWAFCGAEHYANSRRWIEGYLHHNRPSSEHGFDFDRWTWNRKIKNWTRPISIVCPSNWLASCAKKSPLIGAWDISVIPNPIDVSKWRPIDRCLARKVLGFPQDIPLFLFGASGGVSDCRKGFDLLEAALLYISSCGKLQNMRGVVFGQDAPALPLKVGFPLHFVGILHDQVSLNLLYSAADVLVIPSRIDNLPNIGLEAQACATPVVAFDVGGLSDIVCDKVTGALALDSDYISLANSIMWVLDNHARNCELGQSARIRAETLWSPNVVANCYRELYLKMLE